MTSAELRWFWRGRCPQPVYDWFFKSGLPPGGGRSRVDRYIPQRGEPDISLKRRGDKPDFEVKGLVTTRRSPELEPLAPHIEIWCKWSCTIRGLKLADEVAVTKTRWLRKFDTSKYVRSEIPLGASEKPAPGHSLPAQGCNVELTEVYARMTRSASPFRRCAVQPLLRRSGPRLAQPKTMKENVRVPPASFGGSFRRFPAHQ
jgi:hypothetical protein